MAAPVFDNHPNTINRQENVINAQENIIGELKQGIKATIDFMRNSKAPEEEIRTYLIENCRFSVERAEELLNS